MNKKIVLIAISVLSIISIVVIAIAVYFDKKNNVFVEPKNDQQQLSEMPIVERPVNNEISDIEKSEKGSKENEIRDSFSKFVSSPISKETVWLDSAGTSAKLDEFAKAINLNIEDNLYSLLETNDYSNFVCSFSSQETFKGMGILLKIKLMEGYEGDLYMDEVSFMKNWEKTMLQDVKSVIFPEISFSPEHLQQELMFDGKYQRYAKVRMPDDQVSSISYEIVDDFIIITNSVKCLNEIKQQVYDTGS